jgi:hypothetical protein
VAAGRPWYRWERRDGAEPERAINAGRPALHKYTSTAFVTDFLADPQRSVRFEEVDEHQRVEAIPHVPLPGDARNRRRFLATTRQVPTGVRKLFSVVHQRFYIVAVGLHCEEPGFPRVDPADVAEAGFVVRRQRVTIPSGERARAAALLQEVATAQGVARTRLEFDTARSRARVLHPFGSAARDRVVNPSAASVAAHREVELARRRLAVWAAGAGAQRRTEGWVPAGDGSFGAWVPIDDEPVELVERSYPMRALTPPPDDPDHPAHFGTIFWGMVPTAGDDDTGDGTARISEVSVYELRASPGRPRRRPGRWCGRRVGAVPSRVVLRPDSCAQRPIDLRLPDFAQLEASTALPSVKMTSPPGSSFVFAENGEIPTSGSLGGGQEVSFFAPPLITIVAMFLLKLFLPIVMFVFGLFWMLKLRFRIPPSAQLEADLSTALTAVPGGIAGALSVDLDVRPGLDQAALEAALRRGLDADGPGQRLGTRLTAQYTNDPVVELLAGQGYGAPASTPFPVFAHALRYTTPVTREEVVHP